MTTKQVAVKPTSAVAPLSANELSIQTVLSDNSGSGFEEATLGSFAVPFISILQALSPQCKRKESTYVEGAEEGMFLDSVTGELIDGEKGINVIPVYFSQRFIAWGLREKGGGFKGEFASTDPIVGQTTRDDKGRDIINSRPDEQLVDTRVHYVLLQSEEGWNPAVIGLSSTQVKKSKQWMSRMQQIRVLNANNALVPAPMFSRMWNLTSIPEGNDKGTWMGYKIGAATPITDLNLLHMAMQLKESVQEGTAKASYQEPTDSTKDAAQFD